MRVGIPSRVFWSVVIVLILGGALDSFLLARSYIARNADTVIIVATVSPASDTSTGRLLKPVVYLRYTGAQAYAIKRVFDGGALNPEATACGAEHNTSSVGMGFNGPFYHYTLSFQILGVTTTVMQRGGRNGWWTTSVLGIQGQTLLDCGDTLLDQLVGLTDLALPTDLAPAYLK